MSLPSRKKEIISWILEIFFLLLNFLTFFLYIPIPAFKKGTKGEILFLTDTLVPPFFYLFLRHHFKKNQYTIYFFYAYNPFKNIFQQSQKLSRFLIQFPHNKITVIGHGNSGLLLLSLSDEARKKIQRIITLNTPFWGSQIYRFLKWLPKYKDMLPRSEYLQTYKMNILLYEEFYPIVSWQDEWIFPSSLLKFGQGRDIIFDIPGRLNLILHPENVKTIVEFCNTFFEPAAKKQASQKPKKSKKLEET